MDGDFPELDQIDLDTISTAVERAFNSWLDEWDLRIEERVKEGVRAALTEWLDAEGDNLRETIANAVTQPRIKR